MTRAYFNSQKMFHAVLSPQFFFFVLVPQQHHKTSLFILEKSHPTLKVHKQQYHDQLLPREGTLTPHTPPDTINMPKAANINKIARSSSRRLANAITAELADAIIREKGTNGPFTSWEDLKSRTRGVGPAKIEKMKEAGFVIVHEDANEDEDSDSGDMDDRGGDLRLPVHDMKEQTWTYRKNTDLYTLLKKQKLKSQRTEVRKNKLQLLCC